MNKLYYIIKKEMIELTRDIQTYLLLIIMPAAFILVMSLSMQSLFQTNLDFTVSTILLDNSKSAESRRFIEELGRIENLSIAEAKTALSSADISKAILSGRYKFGLVINPSFSRYVKDLNTGAETIPVTLHVDPAMQSAVQVGLTNQMEQKLATLKLNTFYDKYSGVLAYAGFSRSSIVSMEKGVIQTMFAYKESGESIKPNAAQQSVPAWLVFSMYFIVIPIALVFHTEKSNGTYQRIRSINLRSRYIIAGKMVSYYMLSMIQVVAMLLVGRYIVPLLGGDTIQFGNSYFGLFAIASFTAFNAISYGLLVSSFSKNTQMAGAMGSVLVIIFAAIGGIMVPKFIMPKNLQLLSNISPLSWGMEGFLDIMLRKGSLFDIIPECLLLLGAGLLMLCITGLIIRKKIF
jgi:ABC-2 type transport system permease protein